MTKILLLGRAGQGMKLLGTILANILKDNNYFITLTFEHDSFVRAGNSNSYLTFSKERIDNPIIDEPDKTYDINEEQLRKTITEKNSNTRTMNMTLLGKILKDLGMEIPQNIEKYLPKKALEENKKAIGAGFK